MTAIFRFRTLRRQFSTQKKRSLKFWFARINFWTKDFAGSKKCCIFAG
jgi:hypothetical protein